MKTRNEKLEALVRIVSDELFQASQDTIYNNFKASRMFYLAHITLSTLVGEINIESIKWDKKEPFEPTAKEITKSASEMMPEF